MNSAKESTNKVMSQKEYLKRYLSKTKIKKRPIKRTNVKVIDDNDLTSNFTEDNHELETGEDAPVIAAVIDERPKTIQRLEAYKTSNRWAPVPEINEVSKSFSEKKHQSDHNEKGNIHGISEYEHSSSTIKSEILTDQDIGFRNRHLSKTEGALKKNERRSSNLNDSTHQNRSRSSEESHLKNGEESNFLNKKKRKYIMSPEKKSVHQKRKYSSDESFSSHRVKYSREDEKVNREKISKDNYYCHKSRSPEQNKVKNRKKVRNISPVNEKRSRYSSTSSSSPERKSKKTEMYSIDHSDENRVKAKKKEENRDYSSVKKKKDLLEYSLSTSHESRRKIKTRGNNLESYPLHYNKIKKKKKKDRDLSSKIKIVKRSSSSSSSSSSDQSNDKKQRHHFNKKEKSDAAVSFEKNRGDHKKKNDKNINLSQRRQSPDLKRSHSKHENENNKISKRGNSSPDSKRNLREDDRKVDTESNENNKKPTAEQYYQWGKGLKQIKDEDEKRAYNLHEMAKPLARYVDDEDLDRHLKCIERDGDPLAVIKRNKDEDDSLDGSKPRYKGTFPQNRFGIAPGHKWDGVDRSNGYEVKWLGKAKAKEAVEEEAYKWSTADM